MAEFKSGTNADAAGKNKNIRFAVYDRKRESLSQALRRYEKAYPGLKELSGDDPMSSLLTLAFPEDYPQRVFIRNLTLDDTPEAGRFAIRPDVFQDTEDPLFRMLGPNRTILLVGKPFRGSFSVDSVKVVELGEKHTFEEAVSVIRKTNLRDVTEDSLNEIFDRLPSIAVETRKHLEDWEEYIEWEETILQQKLAASACRYHGFRVETNGKGKWLLSFLLIAEDEAGYQRFRKHCRDNMTAVDLSHSSNAWQYRFVGLRDEKGRRRKLSRAFELGWPRKEIVYGYVLRKDKPTGLSIGQCELADPYVVRLSFELPDRLQEELEGNETSQEDVLERVADCPQDGFLAASIVGLRLADRWRKEIRSFQEGNSAADMLPMFLFDIRKARKPETMVPVTEWMNPELSKNDNQKAAIEKMLSAPDICLIQGPPGTGKTTLIAEAIYQYVIRGKRVFIASQSNDAVDNVLECLDRVKNPRVRILRADLTENNTQKGNYKQNPFSEANALSSFYRSVAEEVKKPLSEWEKNDSLLHACEEDAALLNRLKSNREKYQSCLEEETGQKTELLDARVACLEEEAAARKEMEMLRAEGNALQQLRANLESDGPVPFILTPRQMEEILPLLNECLASGEVCGIHVLPGFHVFTAKDAENQVSFLPRLLYNIRKLGQVAEKLRHAKTVKLGGDLEIMELEEERDRLMNALKSEDSGSFEIVARLKDVLLQIDRHNLSLASEERNLLSDGLMQQAKEFPSKALDAIVGFSGQAQGLLAQAADRLQQQAERLPVPDMNALQAKHRKLDGKLAVLQERLQQTTARLAEQDEEIRSIGKRRYGLNDAPTAENVMEAIRQRREECQGKGNKWQDVRNVWEPAMRRYYDSLMNPSTRQEDTSLYFDAYKKNCNVIAATCNANMNEIERLGPFDAVIIDEVSKANPLELLGPMKMAQKIILVGDHRQLPPAFAHYPNSYSKTGDDETTYLDVETKNILTEENFNRFKKMVTSSFFKNYFENADSSLKQSLLTQYRMHPDIMDAVNCFYDHRLCCGLGSEADMKRSHGFVIPGADHTQFITPGNHAYWVDSSRLPDGRIVMEDRYQNSSSAYNLLEQHLIAEMLRRIAAACKEKGIRKEIGIISFYFSQTRGIRHRIRQLSKETDLSFVDIKIDTVDRFQGQEKDIILCSLVRNKETAKTSEHVRAYERINVALSRAKELLVIFGAAEFYSLIDVTLPGMDTREETSSPVYGHIMEILKAKGCLVGPEKLLSPETARMVADEIFETTKGEI